jgi:hypothetical protein
MQLCEKAVRSNSVRCMNDFTEQLFTSVVSGSYRKINCRLNREGKKFYWLKGNALSTFGKVKAKLNLSMCFSF